MTLCFKVLLPCWSWISCVGLWTEYYHFDPPANFCYYVNTLLEKFLIVFHTMCTPQTLKKSWEIVQNIITWQALVISVWLILLLPEYDVFSISDSFKVSPSDLWKYVIKEWDSTLTFTLKSEQIQKMTLCLKVLLPCWS